MYRLIVIAFIISCTFAGCLPAPWYQKEDAIPQNAWAYNFKPTFTFDITDSAITYQPYFIIRHTQAYPYSNLWILVHIQTPHDTVTKNARINIPLAETDGKWLGRGMGEIFEQRLKISFGDSIKFNRKGTYKISMEQNMRINPLPEIMNVGLRMEKGITYQK